MASLTLVVAALASVGSQPTLIDFYSDHCAPCRQMAPVVAELERRGHAVEKVDVDRQPELAARFRVQSIPCLVVVVDGREVDRAVGVTPVEQLESMLRTAGAAGAVGPASAAPANNTAANVPRPAPLPDLSEPAPRGRGRGLLGGLAGGRDRAPKTSSLGRQPLGGTATPRLAPGEQVRPQPEPNEPLEALNAASMAGASAAQASSAAQAQHAAQAAHDPLQLSGIRSELPLSTAAAPPEFAAAAPWGATAASADDGNWRPSALSSTGPAASSSAGAPAGASDPQRAAQDRLLAASVRLRIEDGNGHSYGSGTIIDTRGEDALVLTCGHVFRDSQGKGRVTVDLFAPGSPKGLVGEVIAYDLESDVGLVSIRPGVPVTVARVAPLGVTPRPGEPVFNTGCNNGDDPTLRSSRVTSIDRYIGPPNLQVAGQPVQGRSGGGLFNVQGEVIGVCNAADPADNEGLFAALPSIYKLLDSSGLAELYRPGTSMLAANEAPGDIQLPARPPHMPAQMPLAGNPPTATETSVAGVMPVSRQEGGQVEVVCVIRSPADPGRSEVVVIDRASPELLQMLAQEGQRGAAAPAQAFAQAGGPGSHAGATVAAASLPARVDHSLPAEPQLATMR